MTIWNLKKLLDNNRMGGCSGWGKAVVTGRVHESHNTIRDRNVSIATQKPDHAGIVIQYGGE